MKENELNDISAKIYMDVGEPIDIIPMDITNHVRPLEIEITVLLSDEQIEAIQLLELNGGKVTFILEEKKQ